MARRGKKKQPFYDIVVAEKSRPVTKKFIEKLGYYNPLTENGKGELVYDKERIEHYIKNGASCSQSMARKLAKNGLEMAGKFVEQRVTKPKKEAPAPEPVEEAKAEEPAAETEAATEEAPAEEAKAE